MQVRVQSCMTRVLLVELPTRDVVSRLCAVSDALKQCVLQPERHDTLLQSSSVALLKSVIVSLPAHAKQWPEESLRTPERDLRPAYCCRFYVPGTLIHRTFSNCWFGQSPCSSSGTGHVKRYCSSCGTW